jgi:hypothetical protein
MTAIESFYVTLAVPQKSCYPNIPLSLNPFPPLRRGEGECTKLKTSSPLKKPPDLSGGF